MFIREIVPAHKQCRNILTDPYCYVDGLAKTRATNTANTERKHSNAASRERSAQYWTQRDGLISIVHNNVMLSDS